MGAMTRAAQGAASIPGAAEQQTQFKASDPAYKSAFAQAQATGKRQKFRTAQGKEYYVLPNGHMEEVGHPIRNSLLAAGAAGGAGLGLSTLAGGGAASGMSSSAGAIPAGVGKAGVAGKAAQAASSILGGMARSGQQANAQKTNAQMQAAEERRRQQEFEVTAPGHRMGTSVRASLLSNFKPSTVDWKGPGSGAKGQIPTFGGNVESGMENLDPATRELLKRIMADELAQQMAGGRTGGGEDSHLPFDPEDVGRSSTGDKVVGGLATAASAAVPIIDIFSNRAKQHTTNYGQGEEDVDPMFQGLYKPGQDFNDYGWF